MLPRAPYDSTNRNTYEKARTVSAYTHGQWATALFNAEVAILFNYKEYIRHKWILDVGCGAGRTTGLLKNFAGRYIGIDNSLKMVKACKAKYPDAHLLQCDARDMGAFENGQFDFVLFSFNGLDSMSHAGRLMALQEIHRVLRQDGIFVFSSHNRRCGRDIRRPTVKFALNPWAQFKHLVKFFLSIYNYTKNKRYVYTGDAYSIVNAQPHCFAFLLYYIDKVSQVAQLEGAGFEVMEMYDTEGKCLRQSDDDGDIPWIYYVARKAVPHARSIQEPQREEPQASGEL